jgi:hypothetical protein
MAKKPAGVEINLEPETWNREEFGNHGAQRFIGGDFTGREAGEPRPGAPRHQPLRKPGTGTVVIR